MNTEQELMTMTRDVGASTLHEFVHGVFREGPVGIDLLAVLAGGALRCHFDGTPIKDYDLFFRSLNDYAEAVEMFRSDAGSRFKEVSGDEVPPGTMIFVNKDTGRQWNLVGFGFTTTLRELAESFDFRCCAMAAEIVEWGGVVEFYAAAGACEDARTRTLTPLTRKPLKRTVERIRRYRKYGYHMTRGFFRQWVRCRRGRGGY